MAAAKTSGIGSIFGSLWRGLTTARVIFFNLLFLFFFILLLAWTFGGSGVQVPAKSALVIAPKGLLVEQMSGDPQARAIAKLTDAEIPETLMADVLDSIAAAKTDDRIQAILLRLDGLAGGGLDKLQRVSAALDDFRASGKTVIASADAYGKNNYLVATAADEIYLHKMGMVLLDGYGRYRSYYKEGIDKLEVDWNVFKVGEYKSAVEPFLRSGMSDQAREANQEWMGDLWRGYLDHVATARNTTREELESSIDGLLEHLQQAGGESAQVALDSGLVDHIGDRDEIRARMVQLVGEDDEGTSFARIGMESYLEALGETRSRYSPTGDRVAVIVARGTILDGTHPPGTIGGDSTAKLIRQARQDDAVKAIVLRVDSGGGSAFASEVIRREFVLAREEGKPVVVSMGSVAASGGYWISTAADEIWASPNTITGSIGIFGMFPTFQKPLAKHLGTRVDGVGTTWLAGALRPDRKLDENVGQLIQTVINRGYQDFLERVAEARSMSIEDVDKIARGRVWSGADAFELKLVDKLGGLDEAIASAAEKAGLGDDPGVQFMEKELEYSEQLMIEMLSTVQAWFGPVQFDSAATGGLDEQLVNVISQHRDFLAQFNDPRGVYAHCMCEVE